MATVENMTHSVLRVGVLRGAHINGAASVCLHAGPVELEGADVDETFFRKTKRRQASDLDLVRGKDSSGPGDQLGHIPRGGRKYIE